VSIFRTKKSAAHTRRTRMEAVLVRQRSDFGGSDSCRRKFGGEIVASRGRGKSASSRRGTKRLKGYRSRHCSYKRKGGDAAG